MHRYRGEPAGNSRSAAGGCGDSTRHSRNAARPGLTCGSAAVVPLQVKKAVEALVAFTRKKNKGDALLLNEGESVHLLVTVWKVPQEAKVIRM